MNFLTIPFRNLKRKLLRTSLLLLIFTIGILSMVTINNVSQSVGESLERKLNQFGANIIVYPSSRTLNVNYGGFEIGSLSYNINYLNGANVVSSIKSIEFNKNISAVAPKLVSLESYMDQPIVVVGVDWIEELKIKNHWIIEGAIPSDPAGIISGSEVAAYHGFGIGDTVRFGSTDYQVTGILHQTGSDDDGVIFMDLTQLQGLSDKPGLVNFVEVAALCSGCPIEDIVTQISDKLPNTDIKALQSIVMQRMSAVGFVKKLAGAVSLVILLTASFMIALFMFTSVNERKREIGVLRSLGFSRFTVFIIFCFEALVIGTIAGVLGYIVGFFVSYKVLDIIQIGDVTHITFDFTQFLLTFSIITVLSVLASVTPAWKASRVDPSEALIML